jgi:HK97 family phage major capsid protein
MTAMRTSKQLLDEATQLIRTTPPEKYDRATQAKFEGLMRLSAAANATEIDSDSVFRPQSTAQLFNKTRARVIERSMDTATLAFFGGYRSTSFSNEAVISVSGGRIEEKKTGQRVAGRHIGAITELTDFGEARLYSGLDSTVSGDAAGYTIPISFIEQVFSAIKMTDQILGAADWATAATATGNPVNIPSLSDTSTSAVTFAEAAAQIFANPSFSQVKSDSTAFPEATSWTSQVVLASKQLAQDAVPALANTLGDAFRVRLARGFGAAVVTTLLADCDVGATTASAGAVTQADLLNVIKSVDPGYASAPSAALAMNWNSLMAILSTVNASATAGDAMFHLKRDAQGRFVLFGIPVLISNSLPDIGSTNKSILFGDWSRLLIRNVPGQFVVRRYDELFAAKLQNGYEMIARLDGAVMHAGGSSDQPIKILQCHS